MEVTAMADVFKQRLPSGLDESLTVQDVWKAFVAVVEEPIDGYVADQYDDLATFEGWDVGPEVAQLILNRHVDFGETERSEQDVRSLTVEFRVRHSLGRRVEVNGVTPHSEPTNWDRTHIEGALATFAAFQQEAARNSVLDPKLELPVTDLLIEYSESP